MNLGKLLVIQRLQGREPIMQPLSVELLNSSIADSLLRLGLSSATPWWLGTQSTLLRILSGETTWLSAVYSRRPPSATLLHQMSLIEFNHLPMHIIVKRVAVKSIDIPTDKCIFFGVGFLELLPAGHDQEGKMRGVLNQP